MAEQKVELARPVDQGVLQEWYDKHNIVPEADGTFTNLPYGASPVEDNTILEQVRVNAVRHDVRNLRGSLLQEAIMVYVGGGPSLIDHLDELREKSKDPRYDIWTSNMTAKYLVSKGITPKYHVILDPTQRVAQRGDLDYESPDTILVLGLQCHPSLFEIAKERDRKVVKFLAASSTGGEVPDTEAAMAACTQDDPELIGIGGGSMTGTRMLYLAPAMGYRELELYGVDACVKMENGYTRAYSYTKQRGEHILEVEAANGRKFFSTAALARQCDEITRLWGKLPGLIIRCHGDTFMSNHIAMMMEINKPKPYLISEEYRELNRQLHESHERYGVRGSEHAPRVFMAAAQLCRKNGKCDVLDYGAGKDGLTAAILAAFPEVPGISYHSFEPANNDPMPDAADLVACLDVLEHVEPECVENVMAHLADLTQWIGIFTISTVPAVKTLADGRNAHVSLHDRDWWLSWVRRHFVIIEFAQSSIDMLMVVQPIWRYRARMKNKSTGN